MERRVGKRGPRVYVDTGQTGRSRTIVAPYSVRAYPGRHGVDAAALGRAALRARSRAASPCSRCPARIAELGDPMAGFFDVRPDVVQAVEKLEAMMRAQQGR